MFKDLDWKGAVKRAALTILIYMGLVYVLNVAFPNSATGIVPLAINAAILFVVFTFFHAFVERRKRRQRAASSPSQVKLKKTKDRRPDGADGEGEITATDLKGRQNPNTSRRKSARRRR